MMLRLLQLLQDIRYSLWFIPTVMVAGAIVLALLAIDADSRIGEDVLARWPRLFGASADGARAMLQMIAGAMITVAGLTFSITVLVLSLAASQYTPRVIRNFMGSRATQAVLGVFVGIFSYCLVVLRSVRGADESFVPSLAVTLAMLLALVGVGVLVYFIHHIATSIQASTVIASVTAETIALIDASYAQAGPPGRQAERSDACDEAAWHPLRSRHTGYLRSVDFDGLARHAAGCDMLIRVDREMGEFLVEGCVLAYSSKPVEAGLERELNGFFSAGPHRTVRQDVMVGIQQLVDIALRALSPGMNDTSTALLCIDYLSAVFARMAPLEIAPRDCHCGGKLRVLRSGAGFETILRNTFEQIREAAKDSLAVYLRLVHALESIAEQADDRRRDFLVGQLQRLRTQAGRRLPDPDHVATMEHQVQRALVRLRQARHD